MASSQERAQILTDREAVSQLQHKVWLATQAKDQAGIEDGLAAEVTCSWDGKQVKGPAAVAAQLTQQLAGESWFWGHRGEVTVTGEQAAGRWLVHVLRFHTAESQLERRGLELNAKFKVVNGAWRAVSNDYRTMYVAHVPVAPHTYKAVADKAGWAPKESITPNGNRSQFNQEEAATMLEDIDSIRRLKYAYWRALDGKRWAELDQVFTPDATSGYQDNTYNFKSRDEIVKWLQDVVGGDPMRAADRGYVPSGHLGRHNEITVTGPASAKGTWLLNGAQGGEYYLDEYVKVGGQWRIKHIAQKTAFRALAPRTGLRLEGTPAESTRPGAEAEKARRTNAETGAQLQRLLDIEEIKRLKHRALRGVDSHDYPALRTCFASRVSTIQGTMMVLQDVAGEDIVQRYESMWARMATGPSGPLGRLRSMLLADHPVIEITGEGRATGRWAIAMFGVKTDGGFSAYGQCEERYVRENGSWRIESSTWLRTGEASWGLPGLEIKDGPVSAEAKS